MSQVSDLHDGMLHSMASFCVVSLNATFRKVYMRLTISRFVRIAWAIKSITGEWPKSTQISVCNQSSVRPLVLCIKTSLTIFEVLLVHWTPQSISRSLCRSGSPGWTAFPSPGTSAATYSIQSNTCTRKLWHLAFYLLQMFGLDMLSNNWKRGGPTSQRTPLKPSE